MSKSNNKQVLVIRSTIPIKGDDMRRLYECILEQKKSGVIFLPSCLEAISVPDDVEIRIEEAPES